MHITHVAASKKKNVIVTLVKESDYQFITDAEYHFDWELERENDVYKLKFPDDDEILGLIAIKVISEESRIEIYC